MESLPTLPFRDDPRDDESFMGFALRMANTNGLNGLYWLYKLLNRERLNHMEPEDVNAVAQLFGTSPARLMRMFVVTYRDEGQSSFSAHGQTLFRPYLLRPLRPQLCPACIAEQGYSQAIWDFSMICACARHQCMLIDACPDCGKKMQWTRPSLRACGCGFIWKNTPLVSLPIHDPCIELSNLVSDRICEGPLAKIHDTSSVTGKISHLSLDALFRILWAFGIKASTSDTVSTGVSKTILRSAQASLFVRRAYARLSDCLGESLYQGEMKDMVHASSLIALAKEISIDADLRFLGALMQKIGVQSKSTRARQFASTMQLTLF